VEIIYRLHASRFKVLLRAVITTLDRDAAELEALRITEEHWYDRQVTSADRSGGTIRERVWNVLCDVVSAFAACRRDAPFFHRSVFRHTQALLWAPVFDNPDGDLSSGSLGTIAPTKGYKLRGFNGISCAQSAELLIGELFEKKRQQICAVWLTTPASPAPFEVLNDATRKYDALRWKYIAAYIDCMRLCNRRNQLETLITWMDSTSRDLPSFYEASAMTQGTTPLLPHNSCSLLNVGTGFLWHLKRYANEAVADILRQEIAIAVYQPNTDNDIDWKSGLLNKLQCAFLCFRRLNTPLESGIWQSQAVKRKIEQGEISELEALCDCYLLCTKRSDGKTGYRCRYTWEAKLRILRIALSKCAELFPTLDEQGNIKRRSRKRKAQSTEYRNNGD